MITKQMLFASTVVLAGLSGAKAADAILYEEPAPVIMAPSFSWGGGYIGGQAGYGWGNSSVPSGLNFKPKGFLGGIYAGYNLDLGNSVVLGIDGDVSFNNLKDKISGWDGDVESRLRWSGATRARVGYAIDRFLPYLVGGVAVGNVKTSFTSRFADISVSQSKTRTGFTVGAGVDYAATDNVIVRLEYRYNNFGDKKAEFVDRGHTETFRNKFDSNDVRLGIAYKF